MLCGLEKWYCLLFEQQCLYTSELVWWAIWRRLASRRHLEFSLTKVITQTSNPHPLTQNRNPHQFSHLRLFLFKGLLMFDRVSPTVQQLLIWKVSNKRGEIRRGFWWALPWVFVTCSRLVGCERLVLGRTPLRFSHVLPYAFFIIGWTSFKWSKLI